MQIDYDASNTALYHPGLRPTVLAAGAMPPMHALCSELSRLVYLQYESDAAQAAGLEDALRRIGLAPMQPFGDPATGTQGFGVRLPTGEALVVFRGTEPESVADIATDLEATVQTWRDDAKVHAGFAHAFRSIAQALGDWLGPLGRERMIFTGHSLGAALATLAASTWQAGRLVTFGSPRVGNPAFVRTLAQTGIDRFVNCCDIVTNLPPEGLWYSHAGPARYIDAAGNYPSLAGDDARDREAARLRYIEQEAWKRGNVIARDLADHAPINYVRALFRQVPCAGLG